MKNACIAALATSIIVAAAGCGSSSSACVRRELIARGWTASQVAILLREFPIGDPDYPTGYDDVVTVRYLCSHP